MLCDAGISFPYIKGLHYNALGLRNEKYFRGKKMSLSLVLPCYNVMKYLPKCLDSIFKNDCNDIEIILVNDGSSDDIGGGLSQYFNKDNCDHNIEFEYKDARIKIIHTCNSGVSAARNTGIENATSDYIVFIDPDDTIKENYFSTIKALMTSTSVDVAILGFYQIVEDKDGNIVKEGEIFPQKNYISNSVEETVKNVLPKYLGYSVEDILEWVKSTEAISKRLEWGAVWRNVYRRDFLNKNQIRFNPSIRLNEDSMFNAMCFSRAQKIRTLNKGFYCYAIRPSGAFMKKRDADLVGNKMALLEARSNIVNDLNERGFNFSVKDYAGSNVMSCFELIIKMPFSARRETKKYISNLLVKESIKILPFTGRKKVDIPLLALKCNLQALMIYAVNLGKLFGVQFQL